MPIYKRGRFWWYSFYVDGTRIMKSAKTTDQAEAERQERDAFEQARQSQQYPKSQLLRYGWVYFVQCELTRRVKIGFAAISPTERLMDLQVGSPTRLVLLKAVKARRIFESRFHLQFAPYRLHGEWFEYSDELREFIENAVDPPVDLIEGAAYVEKFLPRAAAACRSTEATQ